MKRVIYLCLHLPSWHQLRYVIFLSVQFFFIYIYLGIYYIYHYYITLILLLNLFPKPNVLAESQLISFKRLFSITYLQVFFFLILAKNYSETSVFFLYINYKCLLLCWGHS